MASLIISFFAKDHPRIRGEHALRYVRNKRHAGIIPAYAGSTSQRGHNAGDHGDHPRIRGEHQRSDVRPRRRNGIIPAYAGSTAP